MKKPDVILVEDHPIFRESVHSFLTNEDIANVVGEAGNGKDLLEQLKVLKPDILLMDIDMPQMNGLEATKCALEIMPDLKVIVFSMFRDYRSYFKMVNIGAKGFLFKTCSLNELEKAIKSVYKGEKHYSRDLMKVVFSHYNFENSVEQKEIERLRAS